MANLKVEIVTPSKIIFNDAADLVVLPGLLGELGILPGHLPLITALKKGRIALHNKADIKRFSVQTGFAQILPNKVRVLVDACEEIDPLASK